MKERQNKGTGQQFFLAKPQSRQGKRMLLSRPNPSLRVFAALREIFSVSLEYATGILPVPELPILSECRSLGPGLPETHYGKT
jgi:hypothetical protein